MVKNIWHTEFVEGHLAVLKGFFLLQIFLSLVMNVKELSIMYSSGEELFRINLLVYLNVNG